MSSILGITREPYPTQVPLFWTLEDYRREYGLGVTDAWQTIIDEVADVQITVPGGDHAVMLLDYPSDDYSFEIWSDPGKTGTEYTREENGTLSDNEYSLDWESGQIQFAAVDESEVVYVTYHRIMGVVRAGHVNFLQANVENIADGLLNGLEHGLNFVFDWDDGDVIGIDFSNTTGTQSATDWAMYGGDGGGALARPLGIRADGLLFFNGLLPVLDRIAGSVGVWADPNLRWKEGAFIDLRSEQCRTELLRTPIIRPDAITEDVTIDLASVVLSTMNITAQGSGNIEITDRAKITIDTNDSDDDAIVIGGTTFRGDGSIVTERATPTESICQCWPFLGDASNLLQYTESDAINAVLWAYGNECLTRFIGSAARVWRIELEFITTVAGDYVSKVELIEKRPQANGYTVNEAFVGTWGQGNTAQQNVSLIPASEVLMSRRYGLRIECTNATADSIQLQSAFLRLGFEDTV